MNLPTGSAPEYVGALTGKRVTAQGGRIRVNVAANSGEIWLPAGDMPEYKPVQVETPKAEKPETIHETPDNTQANEEVTAETIPEEENIVPVSNKTPEEMTVAELQNAILAKMAGNGPVDDQMKKTVYDNIWYDSLVNWLKSFR